MIVKFKNDSKLYDFECEVEGKFVVLSNGNDELVECNEGFYILDENDMTTILYDYSNYTVYSKTENSVVYALEKFVHFRYDPHTFYVTSINISKERNINNAVFYKSTLEIDDLENFVASFDLFDKNNIPKYKIVDGIISSLTEDEINDIIYKRNFSIYFVYGVSNKYIYDIVIIKHGESIPENVIFYSDIDYQELNSDIKNVIPLYDSDGFFLYKENNGKYILTTDEDKEAYFIEKNKVALEKAKEAKINESKLLLASYLESHPLVSNCHGGIEAEYTVTSEKQALMSSNYLTYTIAKASGLDAKLTWNASGQECEEWTEEEYVILVLQISEYVKPLVSLQQSYEVAINACTTQEELDAIEISYDVFGIANE